MYGFNLPMLFSKFQYQLLHVITFYYILGTTRAAAAGYPQGTQSPAVSHFKLIYRKVYKQTALICIMGIQSS